MRTNREGAISARTSGSSSPKLVIEAFRGYGSAKEVRLVGRVHKHPVTDPKRYRHALRRALSAIAVRFLRGGVPGAVLRVSVDDSEQKVIADGGGYFAAHLKLKQPPRLIGQWGAAHLEIMEPAGANASAKSGFFVPPRSAKFVVISDIDDTIMETGVANKLVMLWRLFAQSAKSRTAFPGVAALLSAFHGGASGEDGNPMLYVSRAPWSLYPILDEFFKEHRIPVGPVLFLRDWGLHRHHLLPRRSKGHKRMLIEQMLSVYADLPFVLIGDSGQRDPEIYTEIVRKYPRRVLAVYIRDVVQRPFRSRAIGNLARRVAEAESTLVLAADSFAIARDAEARGFVLPSTTKKIVGQMRSVEGE